LISASYLLGWRGPWLIVLSVVVGVGAVLLELDRRRGRHLDDATRLDLHR
jgi:hypothetical protein